MGKEQRAMYDCRPRLCSRGKLELTKWRQYVCGIRPSADGALRKIRDGSDINTVRNIIRSFIAYISIDDNYYWGITH